MLGPILLAIGIPIVLSGVLLAAGWAGLRRNSARQLPWWSIAGAAALGYAGGHISLSGWPPLPPGDVTHWLPFVAVFAFLCAAIVSIRGTPVYVWSMRVVIAATVAALLSFPLFKSQSAGSALASAAILFGVQLLWLVDHDVLARRFPPVEFIVVLLILSVGVSVALVLSRTALLGQLAGAMYAALGPLLMASIFLPKRNLVLTPLAFVVVPVLVGLVFLGMEFAYLPRTPALLLILAPTVLAAISRSRAADQPKWRWAGIALLALVIAGALFAITRALPALELYEI
ncbi:MAG: hypothetical protein ACR2IE_15815 [Candidatus Sumerlaeaceae bacterium]